MCHAFVKKLISRYIATVNIESTLVNCLYIELLTLSFSCFCFLYTIPVYTTMNVDIPNNNINIPAASTGLIFKYANPYYRYKVS